MDDATSLLTAARDGDRGAFAGFVRETQHDVWRLCAYLVDRDAADDLVQDVYVRALHAAERYRGDAPARTWLLTIARRTCADAIRRRQRQRSLLGMLASSVGTDGETHLDDVSAVELGELLRSVPEDQREAFVLTQVVGCSYGDAAAVAGVPVGTIRSRVSRAREALAAQLAGDAAVTPPGAR